MAERGDGSRLAVKSLPVFDTAGKMFGKNLDREGAVEALSRARPCFSVH
jgi:hypothetical protein